MEATIKKPGRLSLKANPYREKISKVKTETQLLGQPLILDRQDYDDLIAWKRNRRNLQSSRSTMYFFIGLSIALAVVIVAFEWKFQDDAMVAELVLGDAEWEEIQDIPLTNQPPPPPPSQQIQQPNIIEVPDEEILEEIEVNMDVEATEDMVVEEVEFTMEIEEEVAEEIFIVVEEKPEPIGGVKSFYQYVADHIKYPEEARRNHVEGRVYVQFVVNSEGKISDVVTIKGIGRGCDEEAVRIVEQAPDWNPGKQRGKPVSVRMVLPITFKLYNR
ncbi:protein TonB [Reichenbachiella faecimaris]|uniref:Protein TonB n=1 Tax=Reichenbachiella faecimaris TaxID=692418 RepID=A0A1W2G6J1_REIFA|nr:energy transducer TonB [Reichenbachiella faecimaris]SMD32221.1 protein TonB [Reichenbachiella faecimaris]